MDSIPEIRLVTKFGNVYITPTSDKHIYINVNENGRKLIVRGNEYGFVGHMYKSDSGNWCWNATAPYTSPRMPPTYLGMARDEIWHHVRDWANANPMILVRAREIDINNRAMRVEKEISELEKEISNKKDELFKILTNQE